MLPKLNGQNNITKPNRIICRYNGRLTTLVNAIAHWTADETREEMSKSAPKKNKLADVKGPSDGNPKKYLWSDKHGHVIEKVDRPILKPGKENMTDKKGNPILAKTSTILKFRNVSKLEKIAYNKAKKVL